MNQQFYLGAMRRVRDAVRRNDQEMAVCCVAIHNRTLEHGPTCADDVGRTAHSAGASATNLPSHCSTSVFTVSCLTHTVRGKAFEDEERSKVPPHSNLYRCTKRTTGSSSGRGSASGMNLSKHKLFLFRRDQYVMNATPVLLVPEHHSGYFLIRPGEKHLDL